MSPKRRPKFLFWRRPAARRAGLAAAILAHAVFLGACGSSAPVEELSAPTEASTPPGAPAAGATPAAPAARDTPAAPGGAGEAAVSAALRGLPASVPPATRPTPEVTEKGGAELASLDAPAPPRAGELVGLDPAAVAAFLGPPGFKRRDDPAEIWRYAAGSCFLDLFLYKQGGSFAVAHVEARGKSVVKVSADDCLGDLFKTRNRGDDG